MVKEALLKELKQAHWSLVEFEDDPGNQEILSNVSIAKNVFDVRMDLSSLISALEELE